jgi:hypothetical protein
MTKRDNRKRIKIPKPDRDAVWLMLLAADGQTQRQDTLERRLRAIAKRLNGGQAVRP